MTVYLGDKAVGVNSVVEKEVAKTKYGASIDNLFGDVDENGVLNYPSLRTVLNFTGVKSLGNYSLSYMFAYRTYAVEYATFPDLVKIDASAACHSMFLNTALKKLDLRNVKTIGDNNSCDTMARYCASLSVVNLDGLEEISGSQSCYYMFGDTPLLVDMPLQNLKTINGFRVCYYMFYNSGVTSAHFYNLTTITGSAACQRMFNSCAKLERAYFYALTTVEADSMGTSSSNGMFSNCPNLTEIHFRADAQATIEALSGYSSKFGETNATIYFDL